MAATNTTLNIGKRLVELCKQGKHLDAVNELYANDIISIEVRDNPQMPKRMQGIDAIRKKNQWWIDNHETHGSETMGPFPHGERFIVHMKYDVTPTSGPFKGKRMQLDEAALYTVRDGKIVQEEFFYDM
jgi:ketosteroid isomerase-like protein